MFFDSFTFSSPSIEDLYDQLKVKLFRKGSHPFARRLVIVPSPGVKSWLQMQLAEDPAVGISLGLEIGSVEQIMRKLIGSKKTADQREASALELSLLVEKCLGQALEEADPTWEPLKQFIGDYQALKGKKRLTAISQEIGRLFVQYGQYGESCAKEWRQGSKNWQVELWCKVWSMAKFLKPMYELVGSALEGASAFLSERNVEIHVFAGDLLPPLYENFLKTLGPGLVYRYLLPTSKAFERESCSGPQSFSSTYASGGNLALLKMVQQDFSFVDLTSLQDPLKNSKISFKNGDRSIQLHVAPSKKRELEVIYDAVMGILNLHKDEKEPITPADIIVAFPDIELYEPYIHMAFGHEKKVLDYQLVDGDAFLKSPFVQGFIQLIDLSLGRFDAISIIKFFENPFVQQKHRFTPDDAARFRDWISKAAIRWGDDIKHCNQILNRNYCRFPLVDDSHPGTWQEGIARLLTGLALTETTGEKTKEFSPVELVDNAQADLLGRWIQILKALRADLSPLQDGSLFSLGSWIEYFKALMDAYLGVDPAEKEHLDSKSEFYNELEKLKSAGSLVAGDVFCFTTAYSYVQQIFNLKRVSFKASSLQAVRFCSLAQARNVPAKVLVLAGMGEDFPRVDSKSSFDLLASQKSFEKVPLQNDVDRSLFKEALFSARRYFIMSYTNYCKGKKSQPSVLLNELFFYLDSTYESEGQVPTRACVFVHPLNSFDARNFQKSSPFPSYLEDEWKHAKAFYHLEKLPKHAFIPEFAKPAYRDFVSEEKTRRLGIADLRKMAKNPLQAYFNKNLGLYIKEESCRHLETDETFSLSPLDLYFFKSQALSQEIPDLLAEGALKGLLPSGLFRDVSEEKIREEFDEQKENLDKMLVDKDAIFNIDLAEHCRVPIESLEGWQCPPLQMTTRDGLVFTITGRFEMVVQEGLVVMKSSKFDDLIQVWPEYLVFCTVLKLYNLPIKSQLLTIKDGKTSCFDDVDPKKSLEHFLDYFVQGMELASPLVPSWTKSIMQQDSQTLEKTIESNLVRSGEFFFNDSAKWAFDHEGILPDAKHIVAEWGDVAKTVFGPLAEAIAKIRGKTYE